MGLLISFIFKVKAVFSKFLTKEPLFTQPNSPPFPFEPISSEYNLACSENETSF